MTVSFILKRGDRICRNNSSNIISFGYFSQTQGLILLWYLMLACGSSPNGSNRGTTFADGVNKGSKVMRTKKKKEREEERARRKRNPMNTKKFIMAAKTWNSLITKE